MAQWVKVLATKGGEDPSWIPMIYMVKESTPKVFSGLHTHKNVTRTKPKHVIAGDSKVLTLKSSKVNWKKL